jgi:chemotaxis protein methyltransferase CheR
MELEQIENIEIDLFLDAIYRRYGYDFRHYARASVRRRLRYILGRSNRQHLSELFAQILHDEGYARSVIYDFSITVTEMFRDPDFYHSVRKNVLPYLKTYPFFKVWVSGCATGEEVYSLAILLKEEELLERATLFATDFNETALKKAREGIYSLKDVQQYTLNYQKAGGSRSFADYYHAEYESVIMDKALRKNITFAPHNLVADTVFSEVQLVFCRNVLIYFDRSLQNWALSTLTNSLTHGGFLCLGNKESIDFSGVRDQYKTVDAAERIYQKRAV